MDNPTESHVTFDHKKKELAVALYKAYFGKVTKVCKEVQIDKSTFYEWKKTDEKFKQAIENVDFDDYLVDLAEQQMIKLIKGHIVTETQVIITSKGTIQKTINKEVSPSEKLITYLLENKGKNRGYSPKEKDGDKPNDGINDIEKRERILQEMLERAKQENKDND